jgi:hypothetical protein
MDIAKEYTKIYNSYKKTVVFKIGDEAGFFSEYNNMILAMLYCLENKYRFVLTSKNANFASEKGWQDYFSPFCEEKNTDFHLALNHRPYNQKYIYPAYRRILKKMHLVKSVGIDFPLGYKMLKYFRLVPMITQEIFDDVRKLKPQKLYEYPTLNIKGNLKSACQKICEITWRFNPEVENNVAEIMKVINLPSAYIGMHIRSGDKLVEHQLFKPATYFKKVERRTTVRNVFILTDDYHVIEEVQKSFPEWKVFTTCKPEERGYFHKEFMKKDKAIIKEESVKLFASIEILAKAQMVVGTYSSNPGMFLGMKINSDKFIGVDFKTWQLW